eukprot:COSAG02_NODE_404_length_23022_cov_305.366008_5_plen_56_part_00
MPRLTEQIEFGVATANTEHYVHVRVRSTCTIHSTVQVGTAVLVPLVVPDAATRPY